MICDLHCHTKLSDGSLGIEEIIAQAKKTNIDFISTDPIRFLLSE